MSEPIIKDSGQRQEFSTGSRRDLQDGKGRFDLMPVLALFQVAKHFEAGSKKYGDRNWEKGQPLARYMDSALRHALKHLLGLRDEPHLVAACWNLLCLLQTDILIKAGKLPKELDNLPEAMDKDTADAILALLEGKNEEALLRANPSMLDGKKTYV